jgi:hypothetical protein
VAELLKSQNRVAEILDVTQFVISCNILVGLHAIGTFFPPTIYSSNLARLGDYALAFNLVTYQQHTFERTPEQSLERVLDVS